MKSIRMLMKLANESSGAHPPPIDVRDRVLLAIDDINADRIRLDRQMLACAGVSLLAAAAVAVFALPTWVLVRDPWSGFLVSLWG